MARYETGFDQARQLLRSRSDRVAYGLLALTLVAVACLLDVTHSS